MECAHPPRASSHLQGMFTSNVLYWDDWGWMIQHPFDLWMRVKVGRKLFHNSFQRAIRHTENYFILHRFTADIGV